MWSWLIIILISLTCLFCFISVVQLELRKPNAKIWIILTCCSITGVVGSIICVPSPVMQKYSFTPKPPSIEIKELPREAAHVSDEVINKLFLVNTSQLYVRVEPDLNAEVLDSVQYGQILKLIESPADLDWVKIQTDNGTTGWVLKSYVESLPEVKVKSKELEETEQTQQPEQQESEHLRR